MKENIGIPRVGFMNPAKMRFRLVGPIEVEQDEAQVIARCVVPRREFQGAAVARHRAFQVAGRLAGGAELVEVFGVGGVELHRLLELHDREGRLVAAQQFKTALVAGWGRACVRAFPEGPSHVQSCSALGRAPAR